MMSSIFEGSGWVFIDFVLFIMGYLVNVINFYCLLDGGQSWEV